MAQPKAPINTYNTDWAKVNAWAQQQKIPQAAVKNVLALDQQRIQSGYTQMSDAQRTRAILAAAGMNYNTALPTDQPGASDVVGNTIRNVQGIATGLMPTRLFSNIWGTLKNTVKDIEHPDQTGGLGKALETTALSWLPGAYDLGQVIQAHGLKKGLEDLATQPVSSILDVMPFLSGGDAALGALAATGRIDDAAIAATTRMAPRIAGKLDVPDVSASSTMVGDVLGRRLGVAPKAVAKMGAVRMAGKAVGSITVGKKLSGELPAVAGKAGVRVPTLAERGALLATKSGLGKTLATAAHMLGQLKAKFSAEYRAKRKDLKEKVAELTPDEIDPKTGALIKEGEYGQFNRIMHSGMSAEDVLFSTQVRLPDGTMETVSPKVKMAVKSYLHWQDWHQKLMLGSKRLLPMQIQEADGSITTGFYDTPTHSALQPFYDEAEAAMQKADKLSRTFDEATATGQQLDEAFAPMLADMATAKNQIINAVGQTTEKIPAALGKVTGKGGHLDAMQAAAQRGDWTKFLAEAKKAQTALTKLQLPALEHLKGSVDTAVRHGEERVKLAATAKRASTKTVQKANHDAEAAQYRFLREVTRRAPEYRDAISHRYFQNLLQSDKREATLDAAAKKLTTSKEEGGPGFDQKVVDQLRRENPQRLYEIVAVSSDPMFHDPFLPGMTPQDHAIFLNDALKQITMLRSEGHPPMWVPTLSGPEAEDPVIQGENVYVNPSKYPTVNSSFSKAMDASHTVNDVMLGVNRATQELLGRHAAIEFTMQIVVPMLKTRAELEAGVQRETTGQARMVGQAAFKPGAVTDAMIENHFGMAHFSVKPLSEGAGSDLEEATGLTADQLGLDPTKEYYLPAQFKKQLPKLVGDQFPLHGAWDKTTGVFKWSILALSPRYTAHILFGGGMMLALAIDPRSIAYIGKAAQMVHAYHKENLNDTKLAGLFQGATPRGSPEQDWAFAGGDQMRRLAMQEWLSRHGINPKLAKGVDLVKAAGDLNFRFTNYISDMQRSIAYLDGIRKAKASKYMTDPISGERVEMDEDMRHFAGLQAAERVMGNLQAMTPLERSVARKVMPFYGWTKHVLKYVLQYPTDHPWRVMFLSTLATQNTDRFSSGLDERMQLLFFLGQPDVNGNVSAVDVRAMDPFRDVANYATLQGWLSGLNPILTAPVASIDPSIIYGGNVLHPNITYSSLYGTNVAQPSGGLLTAAEQEIPEIGALDSALGLSASARAVKRQGGTAALKNTLSSLGFPWVIQHLNLQQISAKHEVDRYNQAAADAATAWQTGDFSALSKYPGTVPDPLGRGYNIKPEELEKQYQKALKLHPGLPPSETIPNLPTAPL